MVKIYQFQEHAFKVEGEKHDMISLAKILRESDAEGTLGDLCYQIEYAFDIDGVRSDNTESEDCDDPDYEDNYLKEY